MKPYEESKRLAMQISGGKTKLGLRANINQNMHKNENPNEHRSCTQR